MENASVELALSAVEQSVLDHHEAVIERGKKTFVEVGAALMAIRDDPRRLYRRFGTFEEYCQKRWEWRQSQVYRLMDAAEVVRNLKSSPIGELLPANEAQARPLTTLKTPEDQREAWEAVIRETGGENITAAQVEKAVRVLQGKVTNIHVSDDSYEWYTPKEVIEAAREVMGEIDLDPATSTAAQENVRATHYYTKENNGLVQQWGGRVFCNPPYSAGLARDFANRLKECYLTGVVEEGILLVNNATDTDWFQSLLTLNCMVCFPDGRLKFWSPNSDALAARQGQAVFYLGVNQDRFSEVFGRLGAVVRPA